jgi:hypothetical protein
MTNTIQANPLFVDATNNDFRLSSSSPAIDAALGSPQSTTDFDLNNRSLYSPTDVGAFEYTGSTPSTGLLGEYYDSPNLSGAVVATRDEGLAFGWGDRAPVPQVSSGNFSVQWTGYMTVPVTGTYYFRVRTSNGMKRSVDNVVSQNSASLTINSQSLVTGSFSSPSALVSQGIVLTANQPYTISADFESAQGNASFFLDWATPAQPAFVVVPRNQLTP